MPGWGWPSLKELFVIFFKQKTAYEIYQCDMSSDVCSSDLGVIEGHAVGHVRLGFSVQNRSGEEAEIARGPRYVEVAREGQGLAGVDRFRATEFLEIAFDQVGAGEKNEGA